MKISFQRSGGFAGLTTNLQLDPAKLSEDKAEHLVTLLNNVFPWTPPTNPTKGADLQAYDVVVEDGDHKQDLHTNDADATEDMHALFEFILNHAE